MGMVTIALSPLTLWTCWTWWACVRWWALVPHSWKGMKEYGKHVLRFMQLSLLYGKCHGWAHLLDQVHHQDMLRKQTECDSFRLDCHAVCKSVVHVVDNLTWWT